MFSRREFLLLLPALMGSSRKLVSSLKNRAFSRINKKSESSMQNQNFEPSYLQLHRSGKLKERGKLLWSYMENCDICPRECGANRLDGETGVCGADSDLVIASYGPHFGEESELVGSGGSGTIFLTHCSLRCVFCINPDISQRGNGSKKSIDDMADMMLSLQNRGCHNINVVTPTHYLPHILLALDQAAERGLQLPLVYNTSGYEKLEMIKKLDGIVDIYLPDFKYAEPAMAEKYSSGADDYPQLAKKALLEMHRQVGVAKPNKKGIMEQGLMIRHLVMPNNVSGTEKIIDWIAESLPKETYLNIMSQYRPVYKAHNYPEISRSLTRREYARVVKYARNAGLTNLEIQGY